MRGHTEATGGLGHAWHEYWQDYLTAAQELDAVRRQAAIAAAEQQETLRAGREELVAVRRRLTVQQARFAEVTGRHGVRLPPLAPTGVEVNAVVVPGHGPTGVLAALREAQCTIDDADAELTAVDGSKARGGPAHRASFVRNLAGYAPFPLIILVLLMCAGFGVFLLLR